MGNGDVHHQKVMKSYRGGSQPDLITEKLYFIKYHLRIIPRGDEFQQILGTSCQNLVIQKKLGRPGTSKNHVTKASLGWYKRNIIIQVRPLKFFVWCRSRKRYY